MIRAFLGKIEPHRAIKPHKMINC